MALAGDGEDEEELTGDDAEDDVSGTVDDEELVARDGVDDDDDVARRSKRLWQLTPVYITEWAQYEIKHAQLRTSLSINLISLALITTFLHLMQMVRRSKEAGRRAI